MKKLPSLFIALFLTNVLFAQVENYKIAMEHFQKNYNAENYDEIFDRFSSEMKEALPLENTKQFLISLKSQAGKIESKEFVSYQHGTYAMYKTKFEKAILAVNISLDGQSQVNGLFIELYKEPKETESKTVSLLDNYPEEIAKIIYSKSKDFPNNAQLSIAVTQDDHTDYYGIIKINDTIQPVDNHDKVFEIGSITKVFTSTVLAELVEDKQIRLTDDINSYYPFTFKDNIKISFESLANHSSGLPRLPENLDLSNQTNPYKNYGQNEINEYLREVLKLENEPLKKFSYSNLGAGLLGYTLGLSQKKSFQQLLQEKIFSRYSMNNSFTSTEGLGNKLVKGLYVDGETASNWEFDVLFGGGGILSTAEDLAKFASVQFDSKNKELALTRIPTFVASDKMKMGLGWIILKSEDGKDLFFHNGGTAGYSSSMVVNVIDKIAVIVLSNVSEINRNVEDLCFELMERTQKK